MSMLFPIKLNRTPQNSDTDSDELLDDNSLITVDEEVEIPVDIARRGNRLIVTAPIVGANLEDVNVTVSHDILFIHKRETRPSEAVDNYYQQECHWGSIARELHLPVQVDPTHAEATLRDGILEITIPIISSRKTKIVKIR